MYLKINKNCGNWQGIIKFPVSFKIRESEKNKLNENFRF
jgi:hypothetical protein